MDLKLKDKVAVVLAASKGLGKAAALALAAEGCKLAICSRDAGNIAKTAEEIAQSTQTEVFHKAIDVGSKKDLDNFIAAAGKEFGAIDILVTNAGGPPVKNFAVTSDEEWQYWYDVTFMSVVRSVQAVLPLMQRKGWGRIINITSVSVKAPVERLIYSNALRLAVVGLAKSLSAELGPMGITVNNVAPGYHLTAGLERIIKKRMESGAERETVLSEWTKKIPVGRLGQPRDLAGLITFLASGAAGYINGATIQVDGGLYPGTM